MVGVVQKWKAGIRLGTLALSLAVAAGASAQDLDVRLKDSLSAANNAASYQEWALSGETPWDVIQDLKEAPRFVQDSACARFLALPPDQLAHFDMAVYDPSFSILDACRGDLLTRLAAVTSPAPPLVPPPSQDTCAKRTDVLGTARTIEIDPTGGPIFGTLQSFKALPLKDKELVLTFDDGPHPVNTPKVLNALAEHCVQATFFMVGAFAQIRPEIVDAVAARGHLIANHTWSHEILTRVPHERAVWQMTRGQQALEKLVPQDGVLAPYFRFPGLAWTSAMHQELAARNVAVLSADIGTDDWRRITGAEMVKRAKRYITAAGSGIVIFHDTRSITGENLGTLLDWMHDEGYSIVHVKAKSPSPSVGVGVGIESPSVLDQVTKRSAADTASDPQPENRLPPAPH